MTRTRRRERHDVERSLVGFLVGNVSYAVPISYVREIINPITLTDFPRAPAEVAGIADHRGDVVTVIDLRRYFGLPPSDRPTRSKWILIDGGGSYVGLIVDKVTDVFGTAGRELKPPPDVAGADARGVMGVTSQDGRLTFVLDSRRFGRLVESLRPSLPSSTEGT